MCPRWMLLINRSANNRIGSGYFTCLYGLLCSHFMLNAITTYSVKTPLFWFRHCPRCYVGNEAKKQADISQCVVIARGKDRCSKSDQSS